MTRRQYPNPPIEEAVCEFRFAPGPKWNLTIPGLFYEKIRNTYPGEPQQQDLIDTDIFSENIPANHEITVKPSITKLIFASADEKRLVGVGPDMLSIHSLDPYQGWEEFYPRIEQAFWSYLQVANPTGVKHIALRYINKIAIPSEREIDISDYFTIYPELPSDDEFPNRMSSFFTRTELLYEDIPARLTITFTDALSEQEGVAMIVLDIEISQNWIVKSLPLQDALPSLFELKLRQGQAFESLITDRTRELFDGIQ